MGNESSLPAVKVSPVTVPIDEQRAVTVYTISDSKPSENSISVFPDAAGRIVGLKVWPGAISLARFLVNIRPDLVRGKDVVELGCGVGLAGLAVAKWCEPRSVVLTDRPSVAPVVEAGITANKAEKIAKFEALDWGVPEDIQKFNRRTNIVIGSELVYAEEQEPLAHVLESIVSDLLILCYTERSSEDSSYFASRILGGKFELILRHENIYVFTRRKQS